MDSDPDTDEGDPSPLHLGAYWVQGASDEQRDAHSRAQRWSHVLEWQIDRLYAARAEALEADRRAREAMFYGNSDRWPFMRMDAEAHFALVAARQLLRALGAFDGKHRLPEGLTNAQVRDVRDALEHWDAPGGSRAAQRLERAGANPASHRFTVDGPGILGDVVSDATLRAWAVDVYAELERWDPYDGWRPEPER